MNKRRRFTAYTIDFLITSISILILVLLLSVPLNLIDYSKGIETFADQYEQVLKPGYFQYIVVFIYETLCYHIFGRTYGMQSQRFKVVPTQQIPAIGLFRRIIRMFVFSNVFFFLISAAILILVPPFKSVEDHLLKFEIINDEDDFEALEK